MIDTLGSPYSDFVQTADTECGPHRQGQSAETAKPDEITDASQTPGVAASVVDKRGLSQPARRIYPFVPWRQVVGHMVFDGDLGERDCPFGSGPETGAG
jgi:hypothetical protein